MKSVSAYVSGGVLLALLAGGGAYLWQTSLSPQAKARSVVRAHLNDPESAVFRGDFPSKNRATPGVWCGELNARNRMGGMVGFTRYVAEIEQDRSLAVLDTVTFDSPSMANPSAGAAFESKWRAFCE
ncbi:hypothetical protein [uncultured Pseudacidovorax sp.]|uniref:hypothetical protein n=1 Tax=uncultured Pseudacidovorax sp. TaxID=679313 RepID=UPI0025D15648|nr:hypothetical protein [uncultured Pseudacidovorax sp.]